KEIVVGSHSAPPSRVVYCKDTNILYTGGWDKTVRLWNVKNSSDVQFVTKFDLPGKVYSMDITTDGTKLVVGTSSHHVLIYDTKQNQILQKRISSLKYQIRCIKCFLDNSGFAISSTEGRVAM